MTASVETDTAAWQMAQTWKAAVIELLVQSGGADRDKTLAGFAAFEGVVRRDEYLRIMEAGEEIP